MTISPKKLYEILLDHFGYQDWWPIDKEYHCKQGSDPRFEIMVGAILTQNTAWTNVEKALKNLKKNKTLTLDSILHMNEEALRTMIQPSGFFNQKAQRLKGLTSYLHENYKDDLQRFFSRKAHEIRQELLRINGIGPETADSMLLYAGNLPIFVVDAYTKRIGKRIPLPINGDTYDDIQNFFEKELQKTVPKKDLVSVYKELHALLVILAKNHCQKKPRCVNCPLTSLCKKSF